jgi:hypothetical protein
MIPNINLLLTDIQEYQYGNKTYKIKLSPDDNDSIDGFVNDLDAIKQAIYLIFNTERYAYNIYSWNYGIELVDLIGQPFSFVVAVLPKRIEDALKQDDRIEEVKDFNFTRQKNKLYTTFTVVTNVGEIQSELEVVI